MFAIKPKFAWRRIVLISLVVIALGVVLGKAVRMEVFNKNYERSAAFIESLRPSRPEGVGAEDWNGSVDITVTAFCNVCTYDDGDRSQMIIRRILALKSSPPHDASGKLCKIWELLYYRCSARQKEYLDRHRKAFFRVPCAP